MVFFVVTAPNQVARVFRTVRPSITIGRSAEADLTLPNISVSRMHARFTRGSLEALSPDNAILVNGAPHTAGPLPHKARIVLGKYELRFYDGEQISGPESLALEEMPPHMHILSAPGAAQATHAIPASVHARAARQARLRENAALIDAEGKRWGIGESSSVGPGGDIPASALVPAPLATIAWQGSAHHLRRRGWVGRVAVNGSGVREHTLRPGDQLQIGRSTFTYAIS